MPQSEIDAVREGVTRAPSHGRLVGLKGENGSTRLAPFGPQQRTCNSLPSM